MTIIVITVAASVALFTVAAIFVPGLAEKVTYGISKALFGQMKESRDERIEKRRRDGIFWRIKERRRLRDE